MQKFRKNRSKTIQNRVPGPPKLRLEPPRRHFLKTSNLRRQKRSCGKTLGGHFRPTWLHLGGPRCSKIKAETQKNRCSKTIHFWHRFLKCSGLVLAGFLIGFLDQKSMQKATWRKSFDVHKTLFLVGRNHSRPCQQTTKI